MIATERTREDIAAERVEWEDWKTEVDPHRLVFVDETGVRTNLAPKYGWSLRGQPCVGDAPGGWKSCSIISAIRLSGVVESATLEGAYNKKSFKAYMEEILLPTLKRGDIVVMDNLSVHKNSLDAKLFKRKGVEIKYLPRYSPDQNPIELMWAKLKGIIRRACARTLDGIWDATNEALWSITPANIHGWFRGCGYLQ